MFSTENTPVEVAKFYKQELDNFDFSKYSNNVEAFEAYSALNVEIIKYEYELYEKAGGHPNSYEASMIDAAKRYGVAIIAFKLDEATLKEYIAYAKKKAEEQIKKIISDITGGEA